VSESAITRSTAQKIAIFRWYFSGLPRVYGTYDPASGRVRQVKAPVTDRVILDHLQGKQSYGVYMLVQDRTRAVATDFDVNDLGPPIEFVRTAHHYGIASYIERSKSKGYHAWIFFEECGVPAWKARVVVRHLLAEIEKPFTEVFPKHDSLDTSITYGSYINAPLFGRLVPQGRTVFLDLQDPSRPAANQWDLLESIAPVAETTLDEIIEINELNASVAPPQPTPQGNSEQTERTFGLPPCAQKMLSEGVTECQRISCFRLAVNLKKAGLPVDLANVVLNQWAMKNAPQDGKRIITEKEILAQTKSAYTRDYRGCGCEDPIVAQYCDPQCPLHRPPQVTDEKRIQNGGATACNNEGSEGLR